MDLTGQKFGRWTVVQRVPSTGNAKWECLCECGSTGAVKSNKLRGGASQSCGCLALEIRKTMHRTHGMADTPEYVIWSSMKQRCADVSNPYYGGKGVQICTRWAASFEAFYRDMGVRPDGMSIDRIDSSKGYSKSNCRWATTKDQSRNRSSTIPIIINGETRLLSDWLQALPISYGSYRKRLAKGWSKTKALTIPARKW